MIGRRVDFLEELNMDGYYCNVEMKGKSSHGAFLNFLMALAQISSIDSICTASYITLSVG